MSEVVVVLGAGSIGQAIARRVGAGKRIVVSDLRVENAESAAEVMRNAGFEVSTHATDVPSRDSVHELVGPPSNSVMSRASSTPPASLQARLLRPPSSPSISTAPPSSSRSSATWLPQVGQGL